MGLLLLPQREASAGGEAPKGAAPAPFGPPTLPHATPRPPALVTEYMSQGSLQQALARGAEIVQGPLARLTVAIEAAKAGYLTTLHARQ